MKKKILSAAAALTLLLTACGDEEKPVINLCSDPSKTTEATEPATEPTEPTEKPLPEKYTIKDFPLTLQMPELPTGCEITAMTMVLNFYGYDVDKCTMAKDYLPTVPCEFEKGKDGRLYGADLGKYFVGDPFNDSGTICETGAVITAANKYLKDRKSYFSAVDKTGAEPEELYRYVSNNIPVMVLVTICMDDRNEPNVWYVKDTDKKMEASTNDHGAVLIGYTKSTVVIADPISGLIEYDKKQFEKVFKSRRNQCMILDFAGKNQS